MSTSRASDNETSPPVRRDDDGFVVDATLVASLLDLAPADVPMLMRERAITSVCEHGVDNDAGKFRLNFFYGDRQARLSIDASGQVLRRSIVTVKGSGPRRGAG